MNIKFREHSFGNTTCGANREIYYAMGKFLRTTRHDDVYILGSTPVTPEEALKQREPIYLMPEPHHATELYNQFHHCRRCVGNPNRQCDLSAETRNKMNPQTDTE